MKEAYCHICGNARGRNVQRRLCSSCNTKVTKYSQYLREGSQEPEHLELIDYLINRLERKYVHAVRDCIHYGDN